MAEKLSFKGALLKLRKAPNDATAQARVTDEIQDRALLALDGEGNIDVAETDEGVAFASRPGRRLNSMEGRVSLSDWLSRQAPRDEACPCSGRLLYKGKTTQGRPVVDWSPVAMPRRWATAMARMNREPAAQAGQEEIAAAAMTGEVPPVPFSRFLGEWSDLEKAVANNRATPAQRNLHQAAKDACYHEEAPAAAGSSFPAETVSGATGSSVHRSDEQATPAPSPSHAAAPAPGAKLVYIMAHSDEREMVKQLRKHLYAAERYGQIVVRDSLEFEPGNARQNQERHLARASMVVYMVSAALLADPDFVYANFVQGARSAKHIPIMARSTFAYKMVFGDVVALPRGGTVSESSDRDRTFSEISVELQRAIGVG